MRKRWRVLAAGAAVALCLFAAGLIALLRSDWLREELRSRIVSEVQRASGGDAALDRFNFDWKSLTATAEGFTLRGKERRDEPPLFQATRLELKLSVLSWISRDIRLRAFTVEKPRVRIIVFPDGSTNLPQPPEPPKEPNALESLMRLKIERIELRDGWLEFDGRATQFQVLAEGLDFTLAFEAARKRYRVDGTLADLRLPGGYRPALSLAGWLEATRFQADAVEARFGQSLVRGSGAAIFSPLSVEASYEANLLARDFPAAQLAQGNATVSGQLRLAGGEVETSGTVKAASAGFKVQDVTVERAAVSGQFDLKSGNLTLRGLSIQSSFGAAAGEARLRQWRDLELAADFEDLNLSRLQRALLEQPYEWSGTASGQVSLKGSLLPKGFVVENAAAAIAIEPDDGQAPLTGTVSLAWNRRDGALQLDGTSLATPRARLNVDGVLGRQLELSLKSASIRELEAITRIALRDNSFALPIRLQDGEATLSASVRGEISHPVLSGQMHLSNAYVDEIPIDSMDAAFQIQSSRLDVSRFSVRQRDALLNGSMSAELRDWKADWSTPIDLSIRIERAAIEPTLGLFRVKSPLSGTLDGVLEAKGPAGAPALKVRAAGTSLKFGGESVRKASLNLTTSADGKFEGRLTLDETTSQLSGRLRHADGDFKSGQARLTVATQAIRLSEIESLQRAGPKVDGILSAEVTAEATYSPEGLRWISVDGALTAPAIAVNDRKLERFELRSKSDAGVAHLSLKCAVRGEADQTLNAGARLQLSGEPLLAGSADIPRLSFSFLRAVTRSQEGRAEPLAPLPVRGFLEGQAAYSLSLAKPETLKASLTIQRLQLRPRENQVLETQAETSDLTLTNSSPLVIDIENGRANIRPSSFSAKETKLSVSGTAGLKPDAPLSLRITGGVNLAVLSTFRQDVEATGRAELDATVRGSVNDPSLSGRMTIAGASFFLKDVANGIENANGTVFFERNRANIERLTGQTGGGEFQISGFVGLSADDLTYRLSARGRQIRIRYPEGVSTTADAALELIGSPARSLLAGTITVLRSGFVAGDDFGEMMGSASASPISQPAARNEFLRNLQFDIKIRTAPDATLVSSYTEGLQTEANLQIRGSPAKPIILGNIEVNQGAIRFFGNRYTITRGEMLFYNTALVQPEIDLDLETRIRGVTVYIKVSGPLTRLNVNYRSEPPLQSHEILALLTVGRTPSVAEGNLQASSSIRTSNVLENTSSNSLLGGALSAGISSRVERFFGASRIKIDPQATGVDNVAQARLSIEQSLSRDVTVTFITNLSRTQEQIVRVEWDVSRQWQLIAVRDERGVFAVDFIFRKRFR